MDAKFYDAFGTDFDEMDYVEGCLRKGVTVADSLRSDYCRMYGSIDEKIDFARLGIELAEEYLDCIHENDWRSK